MKLALTAALVKSVELSTAHITFADNELLDSKAEQYAGSLLGPKILMHEHGFVIPISEPTVNALKHAGASPEFTAILDGCFQEGDIMYLCFDGDALQQEGLPVFEW